ncbi:Vegetative incompatibility protein HET-E-1 [Lachnellula suecica]|uniref:Vegetative incompatibility protein HET-E-1 n=1 Tax=Lachnellula suecica TaxID=602035 RepID=A0A8T9C4P1_9HELO|nr:Vegetative incompatibility protein HET-E-1 [Lachnellula suecica]
MWLLNATTILPKTFEENTTPPYAILSHTWGHDEVSFQDIGRRGVNSKIGYRKIRYACDEALRQGLRYVWVDTCCIDKTSSVELSEAINSMFRWYKEAAICYTYLADVPDETDVYSPESAFASSRWFKRGWTLQELLAPAKVQFFSRDWQDLGSKTALKTQISAITGIGESFLDGSDHVTRASVAKRMSWASCRETTRTEDLAYCLLGIFDINMPLVYGEGRKAFLRLQKEIMKSSSDQTLFAWGSRLHEIARKDDYFYGPFARELALFKDSGDFIPDELSESGSSYSMTNKGLQIDFPVVKLCRYCDQLAILDCRPERKFLWLVALPIKLRTNGSFTRLGSIFVVRRDEVLDVPKQSLRFVTPGFNTRPRLSEDHLKELPSFLIRKLPSYESRLCIWDVQPRDVWNADERIIRCPRNDPRPYVIRLWRGEGEGFAITFFSTNNESNHRSHTVFKESRDQPLTYERLSSEIKSVDFQDWKCHDIKVTFGHGLVRMSTGIDVQTFDIELAADETNGLSGSLPLRSRVSLLSASPTPSNHTSPSQCADQARPSGKAQGN